MDGGELGWALFGCPYQKLLKMDENDSNNSLDVQFARKALKKLYFMGYER